MKENNYLIHNFLSWLLKIAYFAAILALLKMKFANLDYDSESGTQNVATKCIGFLIFMPWFKTKALNRKTFREGLCFQIC